MGNYISSLFTSLWKKLYNTKEYKICIVGLDNAGKTTILYQLAMNETVHTKPTIGSNVEEVNFNNIKLICWDLGGQTSLRSTWATYFVGTHAVMMVVDSSDRDRIGLVRDELWKMLSTKELEKAILLVYANKQDTPKRMDAAEIATSLNLMALKDINITWHIQGCCALTGEGLHDGLEWLVNTLQKESN